MMKYPNILITGTPGVGKSYLCAKVAEDLDFEWLDVSKIAKENNFVSGFDNKYECPILDEDKLLDYLEPIMDEGGKLVEYHSCDFFPERWFDGVFVVTCDNTIHYDRLKARGYSATKIESNLECEILRAIVDDARDSYNPDIVYELKGEVPQDAEDSIKTIRAWYAAWKAK